VLRGNRFKWEGQWPHLPTDEASRLIIDVITRYPQTMGRPPRRLVIHKQPRFFAEERTGLQDALHGYEYDLVALALSTGVTVMRHDEYPPPRGACIGVGDRRYLYTTGYVPSLGWYPHGHVPAPIQITDRIGDSSARELLSEVLILTKMNWNSARFAERLPVTDGSPAKSARSSATCRKASRLRRGTPSTCKTARCIVEYPAIFATERTLTGSSGEYGAGIRQLFRISPRPWAEGVSGHGM
jgi:hypothetical protein